MIKRYWSDANKSISLFSSSSFIPKFDNWVFNMLNMLRCSNSWSYRFASLCTTCSLNSSLCRGPLGCCEWLHYLGWDELHWLPSHLWSISSQSSTLRFSSFFGFPNKTLWTPCWIRRSYICLCQRENFPYHKTSLAHTWCLSYLLYSRDWILTLLWYPLLCK